MPVFLYKYIGILLVAAGLFVGGFVKGLNYEHDKLAMEQANIVAKEVADAAKLNKILSDGLFQAQADKEAIVAKNAALRGQIAALMSQKPQYESKDCLMDEETIKALQGAVK